MDFSDERLQMTPEQASSALRSGKSLDVDLDTGLAALALTIPYVFRHIDPTRTNGQTPLGRFMSLCDMAGLPRDHPVYATWLTLRALRVEAGDAILIEFDCAPSQALADALGAVRTRNEAHIIRADRNDPDAISITDEPALVGETGVVATPGGYIRVPDSKVTSTHGTLGTALAAADKIAASLGRKAYDADPEAIVELDYTIPEKSGNVDADSIHEEWVPEIASHPDLKAHPAQLIQSATLATVTPPKTSYKPRLTRRLITSGLISDAQFEFIVAAGEAHSRHLPVDPEDPKRTSYRCGIFLADGTGAGKTNEILGAIIDNINHGRRKHIIVLGKRRHAKGFVEAWANMGRDKRDFMFQWDLKASQSIRSAFNGIIVTTYSTIRDYVSASESYPRIDQIQKWAGADYQGIIAFDESQEMRNAAGFEDVSGRSETSRQGLAGIALQTAFPDSRVIYASATGATDVHNLAYAVRLGMWGEGTCFENRTEFIRTFEQGGIADLEQVTLSLKAGGIYMSRSLSFDGVETRHLAVTLTKEERAVYNEASEAWTRLWHAFQHCGQLCGIPLGDKDTLSSRRQDFNITGRTPYADLNGIYEANRKTSMATLIAAFKARAIIADAKDQMEAGNAVVIQMQNTYEAQLNRAIDRMENPNDIRLEPAELLSFAERLPVEIVELKTYETDDGKTATRYINKLDENGNPVEHPAAVAIRNQIIADMRSIKLPLPPLDQIMLAFGPGRLAEVTGRTKRLIPNKPNGDRDGATGVLLEDRTEAQRMQDIEDFHNGKKLALVFSTGAGGASLSYHAKAGSKNTARRIHYVIQLGFRADEVTQGFGRTHRSGQVQPPVLTIVSCDLPADRLYASRIVTALFKLGALTQGHRHASSNGMFDERDCLDGPYASLAWDDLQNDIMEGLIPDYTWAQFMTDLGLDSGGKAEKKVWNKKAATYVLTDINKMINRVAALTDRRQEIIFDHLRERIDSRIEKAIVNGTFNAGPETLKATSLEIVSEKVLKLDTVHKASTRLLRIRKKSELATVSFTDAYRKFRLNRRTLSGIANFCKHRTTGKIALICNGRSRTNELGFKMAMRDIITPTGEYSKPSRIVDREPWLPFTDLDMVEALWNAQVEAAPQENISYLTIVADALLPVWTAIGAASGFRHAVYRLQTDNGRQIVGRPLAPNLLETFFSMVEQSAVPEASEIDEIIEHLKTGSRVAVASNSKLPHYLIGTFTGPVMTGVTLELGNTPSPSLSKTLDFLPTAGPARNVGSHLVIANQTNTVAENLGHILACCPAVHVDEHSAQPGAASANAANNNSPTAATAPVQNLVA